MLVVESVDEEEWVIDEVEPAEGNEEDQSLPRPRVPLDGPADQPPHLLHRRLRIEVRDDLRWPHCVTINRYRKWASRSGCRGWS